MGSTTRIALLAALAAVLGGCALTDTTEPDDPEGGALEIVVAPDPLRLLWVCPAGNSFCFGSLDSTLTIKETAGVAVRLDKLDLVAKEALTSATVGELHFDGDEIATRAGTNQIAAGGSLAVRPVVEGWAYPANLPKPTLNVDISVEATDDNGNEVKATKRVPVS